MLKRLFNNRPFNIFNRNGRFINCQYAGCFTGCGADATREFRKVVGGDKNFVCQFPVALVGSIVEFWNIIPQRTAMMAKRCTTIHASPCLLAGVRFVDRSFHFLIVTNAQ